MAVAPADWESYSKIEEITMSDKALLTIGDKTVELPIVTGSEGERGIDISQLRAQTGLVTYDPSLGNTAVCKSDITFIDGEKGILRYRGIPIEQFTEKPNFVEVAWLLIFGRLPTREELERVQPAADGQRTAARRAQAPVPAYPASTPRPWPSSRPR